MPTKGDLSHITRDMAEYRSNFQEPCHSWTDDLPVCPLSGVGFSTNRRYRMDGLRHEEHPFEDKSFHFSYDDDTYFYGVFDGDLGTKAADFTAQRMPAEILLGQLKGRESDEEIRDVLNQAFLSVEKGFFESIDDLLAEKENLRLQLQGLRTIEAIKQFPEVVQRLKSVTEEIQSGSTAVVALVLKNKLYVANVGDSRAILCTEDKDRKTSVLQLSCDHTFNNEDELLRLSHLGLNIQNNTNKRNVNSLLNCTRCIGNYTLKGGYKEFDNLSEAKDEPIIAEPNIISGFPIDEKSKFLLLMSDGLYKALEEATETDDVNSLLVGMVFDQFSEQTTLNGVAQAVVDKVARIHHDAFMKDTSSPKKYQQRDDITLLVRNFNCALPSSIPNPVSSQATLNLIEFPTAESNSSSNRDFLGNTLSESQHSSMESDASGQQLFPPPNDISLDANGRIKPYVDFSEFYSAVEEAHKNGEVPDDWLKSTS